MSLYDTQLKTLNQHLYILQEKVAVVMWKRSVDSCYRRFRSFRLTLMYDKAVFAIIHSEGEHTVMLKITSRKDNLKR